MDITLYDFFTVFLVVPFLLFRFTYIPAWCFKKARRMNTPLLILLLGVALTAIAGFVISIAAQGFSIRIIALAVAVLAAFIHYAYTHEKTV
ncbi:MAG: hypothetical protein K5657_08635 [Desulfovibrio sp.]|nr:hypothetical protein [Desulfovibrio sp.]